MSTTPVQKFFFLLSLRTISLLSSSWNAPTLTWCRSRSSCFLANFPISFVTVSIWRSLWRSAFLIYRGASTMFLSTLFWNRWMMPMLLCSCVPTAVCRRATPASICVCTAAAATAYCVSTGPIFFPWTNIFSFILVQAVHVFSWHVPSSAAWHQASCQGISLSILKIPTWCT